MSATVFLAFAELGSGCSHSSVPASLPTQPHVLSSTEATELAARLANEECKRRFQRRPFTPDQHPALLQDGLYSWGGLDQGARGGYSALVTFRPDGTQPKVEVYFSTDQLLPRR